MTTEGRKDDAQKARFDLLPPELLYGTANVLAAIADGVVI